MLEKTAVILSGGMNRRMDGYNKAFLKINGKSLIEIMIEKVSIFKEILIVSNNPMDYVFLGVKAVADIIPFCGPLSGIHSGLIHSKYENSFVLPCDMPFITTEVLGYISNIAKGYDVAVPFINNYYQPLCGIYSRNCIATIEMCIRQKNYKITDMYPMVRTKKVVEEELKPYGQTEEMFRNINTHEEYLKLCELYRYELIAMSQDKDKYRGAGNTREIFLPSWNRLRSVDLNPPLAPRMAKNSQ